jgi:anti-sigma-K factor RskA
VSHPDAFEHDDAAYVMGLLSADENAAFERHLQECAACRERVEQLRPTTSLLATLSEDDLREPADPADSPMPETLLPGLLRRAGIRRRRERWFTAGLTGIAASLLVALVVTLWPGSSSATNNGHPQALTALVNTPLQATAAVTSTGWGTRITLDCDYYPSQEVASGVTYALTVVAKDGSRHSLGTWTVTPGRHTTFTSGTALPDSQLRTIQITSSGGKPVLALNL